MKRYRNISRRDFLKFCAGTAAVLGLSETAIPQIARAIEDAARKPPVIWLEGLGCTGCTSSFLSSTNPGTAELLLDTLSLIGYYSWDFDKHFLNLIWRRTYDSLVFNVTLFHSPQALANALAFETNSFSAGYGARIMIIYNH